jgi:hypothetical protein
MKTASKTTTLPAIGAAFEGGFFGGRFFIGAQPRAIIFAPRAKGEFESVKYHKNADGIEGATNPFDGLANTEAMAAAGSPLARKIRKLTIGGKKDWHLIARVPALVLFSEIRAVKAFDEGTTNGFAREWYWTSTRHAEYFGCAWCQSVIYGSQDDLYHDCSLRARAVRTIPI